MRNRVKSKRIRIILLCVFTVIFTTAFIFTDLKLYFIIKLGLIMSVDPAYQYGSNIHIGDDYILISTRLHSDKDLADGACYLSCLGTAAEMTEYMYILSQNDFWGIDKRSVYVECGHRGSGGSAPVESGIGRGTDGMEYSDGHMSTDDYLYSGKWAALIYYSDTDIPEKCMEILSKYEYDKIYVR